MRGLIPRGRGVIRLVLSLVLDAGIIVAGYAVALLLRFDADVPRISWDTFRTAAPLIVAAYLAAFFISGIYRTACNTAASAMCSTSAGRYCSSPS
ncbi:MAG: hypothetical protein AB7U18_11215 [Dehalococcoidia bacterium]